MSQHSPIEWCDHTFNPWWGCTRVSAGCNHCYAEAWAKRYRYDVWGTQTSRRLFGERHWHEPVSQMERKGGTSGYKSSRLLCVYGRCL